MAGIIGFNYFNSFLSRTDKNTSQLLEARRQLDGMQEQMSRGTKSANWSGYSSSESSSLQNFVSQQKVAKNYVQSLQHTQIKMNLRLNLTTEIRTLANNVSSFLQSRQAVASYPEIAGAVTNVEGQFSEIVSDLNSNVDGSYIFSGRSRDVKPVADAKALLNGDGVKAGLRQIANERRLADLGNGDGRVNINLTGATTTIQEDNATSPFGIKLETSSLISSLNNANVSTLTSPKGINIALTGQPNNGESVSFNVSLADGTIKNLKFVIGGTSQTDGISVPLGATSTDTATNLKTIIASSLSALAGGEEMRAASNSVATRDFFNATSSTPPARISPPFASATTFVASGTLPSVLWYQGDDDSSLSVRDTQLSETSQGNNIGFGLRANEQPFKEALIAMGAFLVEDYSANTQQTIQRFGESVNRAAPVIKQAGLGILNIESDFGMRINIVKDASERHSTRSDDMENNISTLSGISSERLIIEMRALQNQLDASYSMTARLADLSLAKRL